MKNKRILLALLASAILGISLPVHAQWVRVSNGLPTGATVKSLQSLNEYIFASLDVPGGGYVSTDLGMTWTSCTQGPTWASPGGLGYAVSITAAGSSLYGFVASGDLCLFRSTDLGSSWTWDTAGCHEADRSFVNTAVMTSFGPKVFGGYYYGLLVSDDSGLSWRLCGEGLPNDPNVMAFATIGSHLFAGTYFGIFRSTDSGTSWNPTGITCSTIDVAAIGQTLVTGTLYPEIATGTSSAANLFVSRNEGATWNSSNVTQPPQSLIAAGSAFVAGIYREGVYVSQDGQYWYTLGGGLAQASVLALTVCGDYVFAGTDQGAGSYPSDWGVWRRPLSDFANAGVAQVESTSFSFQSYPNPASDNVTINFTNPTSSPISYEVIDALGKTRQRGVTGEEAITLDVSQFAEGVYFFRAFIAGGASVSREILVLR